MEILDQCTHYGGDDSILGFFIPLWTHCATHPQLLTKLKYLVETEEKWGYLRRQKAPINGKDLADELGLEDGPGMGRCLLELKKGYRNQVWSKKEEGLSQAKIIAKKYGIA